MSSPPPSAASSTSAAGDAAPASQSSAAATHTPFNLGRYFLDKLVAQDGSRVDPAAAFAGKVVAFYFGAQWCPPCCKLTTRLADMYGELAKNPATPFEVRSAPVAMQSLQNWNGKDHEIHVPLTLGKFSDVSRQFAHLQVVFISSDRDEASYNAYRAEMPWLAVPWDDLRFVADVLRSDFRVSKFPTVIIFSDKGARMPSSPSRSLLACLICQCNSRVLCVDFIFCLFTYLSATGDKINGQGREALENWWVDAYPFIEPPARARQRPGVNCTLS